MTQYFRRPEMVEGKGFRCYNCGKLLAVKMTGDRYSIHFKCPRCHAYVIVRMGEPPPWATKGSKDGNNAPQGVPAGGAG